MSINPLVVGRLDAPADPWAGVWIAEDIQLIDQGVRTGSWVDGGLGVVSAGLDGLATVMDPVGMLAQFGVAWLIEHVRPLSEALDSLAGDPAQIAAHAQTWRNAAGALGDQADQLGQAVRGDVADWAGTAAAAYRDWSGQQQAALRALTAAGEALAAITEGAGQVVAAVRMMVRDAIAAAVSRIAVYAAELVATAGLATPLVIGQVSSLVASWGARIAGWLRSLIASLRNLQSLVRRLIGLIDELKKTLTRLRRGGGRGTDSGRPTSRGEVRTPPPTARELIERGDEFQGRKLPTQGGPAEGVLYKRDPQTGEVTNYTVYDADGNAVRRVDLAGRSHGDVPTPHVVEYERHVNPETGQVFIKEQRQVRPAHREEIP
jgi:uncharacterized protein YukE